MTRPVAILLLLFVHNSLFPQQPKLLLPIGHTIRVNSALFSPDGKMIVTAGWDRSVKIWETRSGKLLANFEGHSGEVRSAAFSPDGTRIVSVSNDNIAKIWDVKSGKLLTSLQVENGKVESTAFSPDGKRIIMVSEEGVPEIWDTQSGKLLISLQGFKSWANSALFSPDGTKVVTASADNTAGIWDARSGKLLVSLRGHTGVVRTAEFSPDGTKIVTASADYSARIWDAQSGKLLLSLQENKGPVEAASFSPEGTKVVTISSVVSSDKTSISLSKNIVEIWETNSGKLLLGEQGDYLDGNSHLFSPDGTKIAILSNGNVKIWDIRTGVFLTESGKNYYPHSICFSPDGVKILTNSEAGIANVWDVKTGKLLTSLQGHSSRVDLALFSPDGSTIATLLGGEWGIKIFDVKKGTVTRLAGDTKGVVLATFSPDGSKIVTGSTDETAKIWDVKSGRQLINLNVYAGYVNSAAFSPDGTKILTSTYKSVNIWDAKSGEQLLNLKGLNTEVKSAAFSPDGTKVLAVLRDSSARIWDAKSGNLLVSFLGHTGYINSAAFSPDGTKTVTASSDRTAKIWDVKSGNLLASLQVEGYGAYSAWFSPDGSRIVTNTGTAEIWDAISGRLLTKIKDPEFFNTAEFSPDGTKIVTSSRYAIAKIWDAKSGNLLASLKGHNDRINSAKFSPDGTKIVTASIDNTAKIWDAKSGALFYTFLGIDRADYLIIDKLDRYDGSETARKLLHFTCGTEVIELDQVKEQLWVPKLAERIMEGDSINAKTLDQLNICGLTPEVEDIGTGEEEYRFKITPRRGGLGETVLYINGNETKRYTPGELKNNAGTYELIIKRKELEPYFVAGADNPVTVKAYIKDNSISSRGAKTEAKGSADNSVPPNLYAVMVGVSDYKGEELDLHYAAKDATDISRAIANASRKLLNGDGKEHVFYYNLTTTSDHYLFPEKNSIKKVLEQIGQKATANDILLVFLSGHGIMQGENDKKQFYFLTADASNATAVSALQEVGISFAELTEWTKPANIKAQKRVMILDACNSGQAIRDFVQYGKQDQEYVAARNDERGQEIKAIEKLNNQSGFFILAASASNQNAYEMGKYSQGLLTYSLLKVIKQQPEILENGKYLDVGNWLNAAKKIVGDLASETGARQEPQLNASNDFNIGVVDEEVRSKIILSNEKPLFARSSFQNAETELDDLKLRNAIDKELMNISSRGSDGDIAYSAGYEGGDAYVLRGNYKINGGIIIVSVRLVKGEAAILTRYEARGMTSDLPGLVKSVTGTALDWIRKSGTDKSN